MPPDPAQLKRKAWRSGRRLRDLLRRSIQGPPAPDDGADMASRALRDAHEHGFVYFPTVSSLISWSPDNPGVGPLSIASVPLHQRPPPYTSTHPKAHILLCHDHAGNFHSYESCRPEAYPEATADSVPFFSTPYLHHVSHFVYFSHNPASCPPAAWINVCHRAGVKVLGSVVIEPHTAEPELLLQRNEGGGFPFTERLISLARLLGFDGWLVNLEFPYGKDKVSEISAFLTELYEKAEGLEIIWYDSVTRSGELDYQDGLTEENEMFVEPVGKSGGLFTNYAWDLERLDTAERVAERIGLAKQKVWFGVDVWAQNTDSDVKRTTYPKKWGGGTNTGVAVEKLAERGFSCAIFGPGWTHEHIPRATRRAVERAMWEGDDVPEVSCGCRSGTHQLRPHGAKAILDFSVDHPRGTPFYFETSFQGPFEVFQEKKKTSFLPTLSLQDPEPDLTYIRRHLSDVCLNGSLVYDMQTPGPAQRQLLIRIDPTAASEKQNFLPLFTLGIPTSLDIFLCFSGAVSKTFCSESSNQPFPVGFYTETLGSDGHRHRQIHPIPSRPSASVQASQETADRVASGEELHLGLVSGEVLSQLGVYVQQDKGLELPPGELKVLRLSELSVYPASVRRGKNPELQFQVRNLRLSTQEAPGSGLAPQRRLTWDWVGDKGAWHDSLPWSQVTGPFAHFRVERHTVKADGSVKSTVLLGRACGVEFPLREYDLGTKLEKGESLRLAVKGVFFLRSLFRISAVGELAV